MEDNKEFKNKLEGTTIQILSDRQKLVEEHYKKLLTEQRPYFKEEINISREIPHFESISTKDVKKALRGMKTIDLPAPEVFSFSSSNTPQMSFLNF